MLERDVPYDRAAGLIKQQKLDEALEDCRQSLKLNPDYARAHGRMGLIVNMSHPLLVYVQHNLFFH